MIRRLLVFALGVLVPCLAFGGAIVRQASGQSPSAIGSVVDQFRADVGSVNNGVGGTSSSGRREINWDGVPDSFSAPNNLPANFFNASRYFASVLLVERENHMVALANRAVAVDMVDLGDHRGGYFGHWGGVVRPLLDWETVRI